MRNFILLALCLVALASGGCVTQSIHPIYSDDTIVTDDAFLGTWKAPDADDDPIQSMTVEARDDKSYAVTLSVVPKEGAPTELRLNAHLVKLDEHRFIDLEIAPDNNDPCLEKYTAFTVRTHTFFRITLTQDTLKLGPMACEWLEEHLKTSPNAVQHSVLGEDNILLTAPTPELQSFLKTAAKDDKAFADGEPLTKSPTAKPAAP